MHWFYNRPRTYVTLTRVDGHEPNEAQKLIFKKDYLIWVYQLENRDEVWNVKNLSTFKKDNA